MYKVDVLLLHNAIPLINLTNNKNEMPKSCFMINYGLSLKDVRSQEGGDGVCKLWTRGKKVP